MKLVRIVDGVRIPYSEHFQQYFRLPDDDLQVIWGYARGIEE